MLGLIGKKLGMTQVFDDSGNIVPVTAVEIEPNYVLGERTEGKHGYNAVILATLKAKKKRVKKPVAGQFPEGIEPTRLMVEFRDYELECKVGDSLGPDVFEGVSFVDVQGASKGKGYQGVVKRHGFRGGRKTHGSKFHRTHGSTGMAASPSRVFKGTKMAGRMGGQRVTAQNLNLLAVDKERNLLLIKGSIPGTRNSVVIVKKAKKK
jgi:large subunit ribosomal protein L3